MGRVNPLLRPLRTALFPVVFLLRGSVDWLDFRIPEHQEPR